MQLQYNNIKLNTGSILFTNSKYKGREKLATKEKPKTKNQKKKKKKKKNRVKWLKLNDKKDAARLKFLQKSVLTLWKLIFP